MQDRKAGQLFIFSNVEVCFCAVLNKLVNLLKVLF